VAERIGDCDASTEFDDGTGGFYACWLDEGHDGPHWDATDRVCWQATVVTTPQRTRPAGAEAVPGA
jgi:hypothetical protein